MLNAIKYTIVRTITVVVTLAVMYTAVMLVVGYYVGWTM